MKGFFAYLALSVFSWCGRKFRQVGDQLVDQLETLKQVLAQESEETKVMLEIYTRQSKGEATAEEIRHANKQFVDIIKAAGVGIYAILPFTLWTIPFFVKLGRRFGIEILPSSYQEIVDKREAEAKNTSKD